MIKKGDLLECIDGWPYALTKGTQYVALDDEFESRESRMRMVWVRTNSGQPSAWYVSRFKVAEKEKENSLFELGVAAAALGPRARRVLLEVAKRLAKGAAEHGDFDPAKRRSWAKEAAEERLDAIVYDTIADLERAGEWK